MRVPLKTRLWLAYKAFMLQSVERQTITPFKIVNELRPDWGCDNFYRESHCQNQGKYCVSRVFASIKIHDDTDHYHVCESCAEKVLRTQQPEKHGNSLYK